MALIGALLDDANPLCYNASPLMELNPHDIRQLDKFFAVTDLIPSPLPSFSLSYIAVRHEDRFELWQANVGIQGAQEYKRIHPFESENIRAAFITQEQMNIDPRTFINNLLSGRITIPDGTLHFSPAQNQNYSIYLEPERPQKSRRERHLVITGAERPRWVDPHDLHWELRSASFQDVYDLAQHFKLEPIRGANAFISFRVSPLSGIGGQSKVKGRKATIVLSTWKCLDQAKVDAVLRVSVGGEVIDRPNISGAGLIWKEKGLNQFAQVKISLPKGAELDCFARYNGQAQEHFNLSDPTTSPNSRRTAYQSLDPELKLLREVLGQPFDRTKMTEKDSYEFESAVARLFWMLGFSVGPLAGSKMSQAKAPDVLAFTPLGNLTIIECTIDVPKIDKLTKLNERARTMRDALTGSGFNDVETLTVLISNTSRSAMDAFVEDGRKLNIAVLSYEDIQALIERTRSEKMPDEIFNLVKSTLRPASPLGAVGAGYGSSFS